MLPPLSYFAWACQTSLHFGKFIKQANPRRKNIHLNPSSETPNDSWTERKQIKDYSDRLSGYNSRNYNSYKTAAIIYVPMEQGIQSRNEIIS